MFNNATNWFDLFYKNGVVHDYNLTVSGGDEKANYRIGGGYYKEEGTIIGTGFERFSFTGNFVNKVGSRLELNTLSHTMSIKGNLSPAETLLIMLLGWIYPICLLPFFN